ncbi:hypothetical protein [Methylobacterium sp. PvR107]|uniref:hypothetical protein n=1 Tax=Methylobacterium sp. PvR107 TaxID=2806597 RepID=UPI001AE8DE5F|nr:hypothetical protein [Methylobacterium sp. PvR107]MBP1180360.1 hypothetical protein [Methylobacterium sp. PvR107]
MPPARHMLPVLSLAALLVIGCFSARASGEAARGYDLWRDCLNRNFQIQAVLTQRELAADAAFQACRDTEDAYLSALAGSPLLADDDVVRARPLLAGRFRAWLIGSRG